MTITWQHLVGWIIGWLVASILWYRWVLPWLRRPRRPEPSLPSNDPWARAAGLPARGPNEAWEGGAVGRGSCLECTELVSPCWEASHPIARGRPKEAEGRWWCFHGYQGTCPFGKQERYAALQEAGPS